MKSINSIVFPEMEGRIPFSLLQEVPEFNFNKIYIVSIIMYLNGNFLMVNKKDRDGESGLGLIACPGGSSERRQNSKMMKALENASFPKDDVFLVNNIFEYIPARNAVREVLEETGTLVLDIDIFGHRKSLEHPDQLVFKYKEGYFFKNNSLKLKSFDQLSGLNFSPIGKSQRKDNPFTILSTEELIKDFTKVVETHKEFLIPFLYQLAVDDIAIANLLWKYNLNVYRRTKFKNLK